MSDLTGTGIPSPAPTVGRIVRYVDPEHGPAALAAIITEVIPAEEAEEVTLVALTVFPPDAPSYPVVNVPEETIRGEARRWSWPPR